MKMEHFFISGHDGGQPQHHGRLSEDRHDQRRAEDDGRTQAVHAHRLRVVARLPGGVRIFLDKNRDKELQHIGKCDPAGNQEYPFHDVEQPGKIRALMDSFHDAFVQERLADVPVEQGHTADPEGAQCKCSLKERLVPSVAPDCVEIQFMQLHDDHAGRHEERQLDHRMVDHVQHEPGERRDRRFLTPIGSQDQVHRDARQDKTDLGHGGAGQRPLQIDRKKRQDCAKGHRDDAGRKNHQSEGTAARKGCQRSHQDAVDADFGQDARQQRGSR